MKTISILGCGRWASFHAWYQCKMLGNRVLMWGRDYENDNTYSKLVASRKNDYMEFSDEIELTSDLNQALASDIIIIAIVAKGMQQLSKLIGETLSGTSQPKTFVLCMKGIDEDTLEPLSQTLRKQLDTRNVANANICVWVGPGHTKDFLAGQAGVMIIDGENKKISAEIAKLLSSKVLKLYVGDDMLGAEVGAACKNVLGLAAGMLDGLELTTLKGGLMARGLWEVSNLITAMGGNRLTAYGLSCLGDFEATMFSKNSHNRLYGETLTRARVKDALIETMPTAEGVQTAKAIVKLAKQYNVRMPICNLVHQIIHEGLDAKTGLQGQFTDRPPTSEFPI